MPKVNKVSLMARYNETIHRHDLSLNDHLEMIKSKNNRTEKLTFLFDNCDEIEEQKNNAASRFI